MKNNCASSFWFCVSLGRTPRARGLASGKEASRISLWIRPEAGWTVEEGRVDRTTKGLSPALAGAGRQSPGCGRRCGPACPPLLQKDLEESSPAEPPPQPPGAGSRLCAGLSPKHSGLGSPGLLGCPLELSLPCWSQPRSSPPPSSCPQSYLSVGL